MFWKAFFLPVSSEVVPSASSGYSYLAQPQVWNLHLGLGGGGAPEAGSANLQSTTR
jgi:hypothetical protein